VGIAIYDRLDQELPSDPYLRQVMWKRRELENYLCSRETLLAFAEKKGFEQHGELFAASWRTAMEESITEIEKALISLGKPSPFGVDIKASDEFLDPLFKKFYEKVDLPNLMRKTDYHTLSPFVPVEIIDTEIREKLDLITEVASQGKSREN
jgi:hypothetical protein